MKFMKKMRKVKHGGASFWYTDNDVCEDIDIDDDVEELEIDLDDDGDAFWDEVDKVFPNVKKIHINENVYYISMKNSMFPNVREVTSDSPEFYGGDMLVEENDGTVLLNTFCKKAGEVINLDGIDMIAANAFNGCESINIINTEYVSICSEGAFKNSAVERLPFVNGVRMVGCMLVGIDNTCDNIVIPDDEINISTIISGLDWSHVKNVTVSHASTVYDMSMTAKAMPKKVTVMSVEGYELKTLKLANISYVNIVNSSHYRTIDGIVYSLDGKCLIACPTGRTGRVDIPEGVEEIARNAFKLGNLEEVYFPSTLKKVGDMAFFYCKNLKKVDFGTGLEMIGSNAEKQCFASCDNLKSIIIPPQVTSIGSRVFENSAVTSGFNNGVTDTYTTAEHQGNCITVASDGALMGTAFYQKEPFSTSNIVSTLTPFSSTPLNEYNALFLCAIIYQKRGEFGWLGYKFSVDRVRNLMVLLPADNAGNPDWDYMENYIKELTTKTSKNIDLLSKVS